MVMTVTATEARKRWFELLKRAGNGEEVVIMYKNKKFLLTAQLVKPDKMEIVERMGVFDTHQSHPTGPNDDPQDLGQFEWWL